CQRFRKFNVIHSTKTTTMSYWLIFPGNAKQVEGMQIPKTDILQSVLDVHWNQGGIHLLSQRRDDDFLLPNSLECSIKAVLHDSEINFRHFLFLQGLFYYPTGWDQKVL